MVIAAATLPSSLQASRRAELEALKAIGRMTAKVPEADEVCFSPEGQCDAKLARLIESAKSSIEVAVYDINLDHLVHLLLVQAKKIRVRILADRRQSKGPKSLVPLLIKAGAEVRYGKQRGIMHHKFAIIDRTMLATGSFNFTNGGANLNQENQLYLSNPKIVSRYRERFERSWSEGFVPEKKSR